MVLEVDHNDTIKKVKELIQEKEGIPVELFGLFLRGKKLEDKLILSDYGITKGMNGRLELKYKHTNYESHLRQYIAKKNGLLRHHTPDIASCPYLKQNKPCPVYNNFIKYVYSEDGLKHMSLYNHCDLKFKPCRYGVECKAYIRLVNNGYRLDDRCHVCVYAHPPRGRQEYQDLDDKVYPFIAGDRDTAWGINEDNLDEKDEHTKKHYTKFVRDWSYPQDTTITTMNALKNCDLEKEDKKVNKYLGKSFKVFLNTYSKYKDMITKKSDLISLCLLIQEIHKNSNQSGSAKTGDWKKDLVTTNGKTLIDIVNDVYMDHPKHVKIGKPLNYAEMLSIVLYTGTECNYAMCKSQREGDYQTWPVFDYCLNNAIHKLSDHETGEYTVFSGVGKCQLDFKKMNQNAYYMTTFVSTSWKMDVAKEFLDMNGGEGVLLTFSKEYRSKAACADVSWISKFGESEKEVLFARIQPEVPFISFKLVDCIKQMQRVIVNEGELVLTDDYYKPFEIHIKATNGKQITVKVVAADTVKMLKEEIMKKTGIAVANQCLRLSDKTGIAVTNPLIDSQCLGQYGIIPGKKEILRLSGPSSIV